MAPTSYPCSTHPSVLPLSPKQTDQRSEKESVADISLHCFVHWVHVADSFALFPLRLGKKLADRLWRDGQVFFWLSSSLGGTCTERKSLAGGLCWSGNAFPPAMFGCDACLCGRNMDYTAWLHSPGIQIVLQGRVNITTNICFFLHAI